MTAAAYGRFTSPSGTAVPSFMPARCMRPVVEGGTSSGGGACITITEHQRQLLAQMSAIKIHRNNSQIMDGTCKMTNNEMRMTPWYRDCWVAHLTRSVSVNHTLGVGGVLSQLLGEDGAELPTGVEVHLRRGAEEALSDGAVVLMRPEVHLVNARQRRVRVLLRPGP